MTVDAGELLDRLDEQAHLFERLLDRHPGRHLLAEYGAALLEPCSFLPNPHRDPELLDHASDLLARMEQVISTLTASFSEARPGTTPPGAGAQQLG